MRHAGTVNPETGGESTVKYYREGKGPNGQREVTLEPANPEFPPMPLTPRDEDEVRVIAEVVQVLP